MFRKFIFFACVFSFNSFAQVKIEKIQPKVVINSELTDGTFIGNHVYVNSSQKELYCIDRTNCRILVFNEKYDLIRSFGKKGRGPGEFTQPRDMFNLLEQYIVQDTPNLKIFSKQGKFVSQRMILNNTYRATGHDVLDENGNFYANSIMQKQPLIMIDPQNKIKYIGKNDDDSKIIDIKKSFTEGERTLSIDSKYIYALAINSPVLDIYSKDGNFVKSLDLNKIDFIRKLNYKLDTNIEEDNKKIKVKSIKVKKLLFQDFHLYNGKMYFFTQTSILCLTLNDFNLNLERIIDLGIPTLGFTIFNNAIIVFDTTSNNILAYPLGDKN